MGPVVSDYNKRLILLSVIQLSGGHCKWTIVKLKQKMYVVNYLDLFLWFEKSLNL
jgi:hypothetical protein